MASSRIDALCLNLVHGRG